jgi:hypothetical protein
MSFGANGAGSALCTGRYKIFTARPPFAPSTFFLASRHETLKLLLFDSGFNIFIVLLNRSRSGFHQLSDTDWTAQTPQSQQGKPGQPEFYF